MGAEWDGVAPPAKGFRGITSESFWKFAFKIPPSGAMSAKYWPLLVCKIVLWNAKNLCFVTEWNDGLPAWARSGQWHRPRLPLPLAPPLAARSQGINAPVVGLRFNHLKTRKMHEYMHQCSQLKNSGTGTAPLRPPCIYSPRRLRHLCPLCPTHFLVPSGAYGRQAFGDVISSPCREMTIFPF